jgi:drug/metabolite transporter (DMT)-like permease
LNKRKKSVILLLASAVLWSFSGILIKYVEWNPLAIAGTRSLFASLVFLTYLKRPRFKLSLIQIGGAAFYAVAIILFVISTKLTTAANAILLQYTAPIYIAIFSTWFLNEKIKIKDWLTILVVLFGIALFFFDDLSFGNIWGNIAALFSGVTYAWTVMFLRKQKDESPFESLLLGNIITVMIGLPFMLNTLPNIHSWIALILLGTFQLGLSYVLYIIAIKNVTALEAILIPIIEPILNPIWVALTMREIPGIWVLIGGFLVISSIITSNLKKQIR